MFGGRKDDELSENFDSALKVAEGIKYCRDRLEALAKIVSELVKAGYEDKVKDVFNKAIVVAKRTAEKTQWCPPEVLASIALELAKAGYKDKAKELFDKAIEIAKRIEGDLERSEALAKIASELARAGYKDEAEDCFLLVNLRKDPLSSRTLLHRPP